MRRASAWDQRVGKGGGGGGGLEEGFGERDQGSRLREAEVGRVEVAQADPVQAVGVLQERGKDVVRVVRRQFPVGVDADRGGHGLEVDGEDPGGEEAIADRLGGVEKLRRIGAVAVADSVTGAGQVVDENRRPERKRPIPMPGQFGEQEAEDHHPGHVLDTVFPTLVREEGGLGEKFRERESGGIPELRRLHSIRSRVTGFTTSRSTFLPFTWKKTTALRVVKPRTCSDQGVFSCA